MIGLNPGTPYNDPKLPLGPVDPSRLSRLEIPCCWQTRKPYKTGRADHMVSPAILECRPLQKRDTGRPVPLILNKTTLNSYVTVN